MKKIASVLLMCAPLAGNAGAAVTASWLAPVDGSWNDATKWSTNPLFPNNGTPLGVTYDAVLSATGDHAVTLDQDVSVSSLRLNSNGVVLNHTEGILDVAGATILQRGAYAMTGGTLRTSSINAGSLSEFAWGGGSIDASSSLTIGTNGIAAATMTASQSLSVNGPLIFGLGGMLSVTSSQNHVRAGGVDYRLGDFDYRAGTLELTAGSLLANAGDLRVGAAAGATAYMHVRNSAIVVHDRGFDDNLIGAVAGAAGTLHFSDNSIGTFDLIRAGAVSGAAGTIVVDGASRFHSSVYLGVFGDGTMIQNGGYVSVPSAYLAENVGARGTYHLNSGTLVTGGVHVGWRGSGTFIQSGGTTNVGTISGAGVYVGQMLDAVGHLELHGGTLNAISLSAGSGNALQTGGLGSFGFTSINGVTGRTMRYVMTGGTFLSGAITLHGAGTLSQSGGRVSAPALYVGLSSGSTPAPNSSPRVEISGGSFQCGSFILGRSSATISASIVVSGDGSLAANSGTIESFGTLILAGGETRVAALSIDAGRVITVPSNGAIAFRGGQFTFSGAGYFDLADNVMFLDSTANLAQIDVQLTSGRNGGSWNGGGIRSSVAAATSGRNAIGFALRNQALQLGETAFRGHLMDPQTTLIVAYTLVGDNDLNGAVNIFDFAILTSNFNQPGRWFDGDFNYDSLVNTNDFALLASNFNHTLTRQVIPEPSASASVAMVALGLARGRVIRRRRDDPSCTVASDGRNCAALRLVLEKRSGRKQPG